MNARQKLRSDMTFRPGWKLDTVDADRAGRTDIDVYIRVGTTEPDRLVTIKWSANARVLDLLVDGQRPMNDPDNGNFGLKYQGIKGARAALGLS